MGYKKFEVLYKEALERPSVIGTRLKLLPNLKTGKQVTKIVELIYIPQTEEIVERLK